MWIFAGRENKYTKWFSTKWCKFHCLNEWELFIVVYTCVGNEHGAQSQARKCMFEYDAFVYH